jgi:hypothetical protein
MAPETSVPSPNTTMKPEPHSSLLHRIPDATGRGDFGLISNESLCSISSGKRHLQLAET